MPDTSRPQPILIAGGIAALVLATVPLVALWVEIPPGFTAALTGFSGASVALVGAYFGHTKVTPTSDPQNDDGERLVVAPPGG